MVAVAGPLLSSSAVVQVLPVSEVLQGVQLVLLVLQVVLGRGLQVGELVEVVRVIPRRPLLLLRPGR